MAAPDDSALKALITSNIPDATPTQQRRATASTVRAVLNTLVDWVKAAINNNLSTWLKLSDGSPGGGNAESIYRTGETAFKGPARFYPGTTNAAPMAGLQIGATTGLQVIGNNGGPAFMEFHLPGLLIHQLGVDPDGILKLHRWGTTVAAPVVIDGVTNGFALTDDLGNRKIVLFGNVNDHQYFGFGINSNVLRYQVGGVGSSHVFYAGASPATSLELMRIMGDGRVGIGVIPAIRTILDISGGWATFHGNMANQPPGNGIGLSLGWNYSAGLAESNIVYGVQDWPNAFLNFSSWNGLVMSEKMRLDINGNLGIGTTTPAAKLSVNGPGHAQFRLENRYTPAGSGDANGAIGAICWDENYLYWKTSGGWKRSAFGSTF